MEVDERGHNRFSAKVSHVGVFGNGDRRRISSGDDMIALDDKHRVLDRRPACPINQARTFQRDRPRAGLSASARASDKNGQKNSQDYARGRSIHSFHIFSPCLPGILVQESAPVKRTLNDRFGPFTFPSN
jgi:hypothetical protein